MRVVFLVGAPRSGTTWLQLMLFQHPRVTTVQETHLFDWYLSRLHVAWERERARDVAREVGLTGVLTEAQFRAGMARFVGGVLEAIAERAPGAAVLLEKTPEHVGHWSLIRALLPEARFVHLVRDPRAVVASLKRAAATWGAGWAPRSALDGARMWGEAISYRDAMRSALGADYHELRYEALRADPVRELAWLFDWMGVDADPDIAAAAVAACDADGLADGTASARMPWRSEVEPPEFYRKAPADAWERELRSGEVRIIEHINAEAMDTLGYPRRNPAGSAAPLALIVRDLATRAIGGLARVAHRRAPWLIKAAERALRETR